MRVENDLHIGAVADQQGPHVGAVAEFNLHIDNASLLFHIQNVGSHSTYPPVKMPIRKSINSDVGRLPDANIGDINLVDRGADVEATVVDQVDGRRRWDAGR